MYTKITIKSTLSFASNWIIVNFDKTYFFFLNFQDECDECTNLRARLETLGCRERARGINVAMVNKGTSGAVTGRRFEVAGVPALIL